MNSIPEIPYGFCQCGCGLRTNLAKRTERKHGWVRGQPLRFVLGHRAKLQPLTTEQRFWAKVDRSGGPDACWPWLGFISPRGYGQIEVNGQPMPAPRYSYELRYGSLPPNLYACHNCPDGDNPRCVNPAHLFAGTPSENTQDMINKGRGIGGERHPLHKLTLEQITEIRATYAAGGVPQYVIAAQYGVSQAIISKIVRHEVWRHPS